MYQELSLSVILPIYNEEQVILPMLQRLEGVLKKTVKKYEIIVVDDGSHDETLTVVKKYSDQSGKIHLISLSRNYGHEVALTAGIEQAQGDYVIQMDADLQHPPELIPKLIEKILEGYDVVYAARTDRQGESWIKKITSKFFYYLARKMTGFNVPDDATNYRILNKKVVNAFNKLKENNRHLLMIFAYLGYKTTSIPFASQPRYAGKSKYSYHKLINLAIDSIIAFSHRPLRLMSLFSILISGFLVCYAGFVVLQKIFYHQALAQGYASVILIISGLFAVLFLFLAVISEYISRILVESKNRPLYYIREEYGQDQLRSPTEQ